MKHSLLKSVVILTVAALGACTTKDQEAPPLTGPSEFGQSVVVAVNPDSLPQDGASQSFVTVTVRDPNGQPMRNVTLRAETSVQGVLTDFGTLSARSITTGSDGRATLIYTAPIAPPVTVDSFIIVDVNVTPQGSDFNNATTRSAAIRLVPPGGVVPPTNLRAVFTATPTSPTIGQTVLFDASSSTGAIAEYRWSFGDGASGSGRVAQHAYADAQTYVVTLTVVDGFGRAVSSSQSITVAAGQLPNAVVEYSPTPARVGSPVFFNASKSSAPNNGRIVSYLWDFGDGSPRQTTSEPTISKIYTAVATYKLTLVVTDQAGRTATVSIDVAITP